MQVNGPSEIGWAVLTAFSLILINVALVPLLLLHLSQILGRMFQGAIRSLGDHVQQSVLNILGHAGRIAADIEVGSVLQPLANIKDAELEIAGKA